MTTKLDKPQHYITPRPVGFSVPGVGPWKAPPAAAEDTGSAQFEVRFEHLVATSLVHRPPVPQDDKCSCISDVRKSELVTNGKVNVDVRIPDLVQIGELRENQTVTREPRNLPDAH